MPFDFVARSVELRAQYPLAVNDTHVIHVDFNDAKRVVVWKLGTAARDSDRQRPAALRQGPTKCIM